MCLALWVGLDESPLSVVPPLSASLPYRLPSSPLPSPPRFSPVPAPEANARATGRTSAMGRGPGNAPTAPWVEMHRRTDYCKRSADGRVVRANVAPLLSPVLGVPIIHD